MMRFYKAFQYTEQRSPLHGLDPRSKFAITLTIFAISALSWDLPVQVALLGVCFVLAVIGKVFRRCLLLVKTVVPLVALLIVANVFSGMTVEKTAVLTIRFIVMVLSFSLLFLTTEPDLFGLMMEKFHLPYSLSLAFSMSLRMIPLMAEQAEKIMDSQRARGLDFESGNFLKRIRNLIPILVPMVVLSIKRSIEIAEALETRGFGSEKRTRYFDIEMKKLDYLTVLICLLSFIVYILFSFVLGYGGL